MSCWRVVVRPLRSPAISPTIVARNVQVARAKAAVLFPEATIGDAVRLHRVAAVHGPNANA